MSTIQEQRSNFAQQMREQIGARIDELTAERTKLQGALDALDGELTDLQAMSATNGKTVRKAAKRRGRPPGTKNRATLEREAREREAAVTAGAVSTEPADD